MRELCLFDGFEAVVVDSLIVEGVRRPSYVDWPGRCVFVDREALVIVNLPLSEVVRNVLSSGPAAYEVGAGPQA